MFRPRIIPVLLLQGNALVKSKGFKDFRYIGDPINAVKIFNDLKADELVFLDIEATKEKRVRPSKKVLIREIAEQTDLFDFPSLERTNIQNLTVIRQTSNS